MSTQRIRAPRGGARGGMHETGEEVAIWRDCLSDMDKVIQNEKRAEELKQQIFAKEAKIKERQVAGKEPSTEELDELSSMYREQVRIADNQKAYIGSDSSNGLLQNIGILMAVVRSNEEKEESTTARGSTSRDSHSRSAMEFDGPSDSPGPSPAENRIRKAGAGGRTSSQPPRNLDVAVRADGPVEPVERNTSKPKIVYAIGDEVAFKRKSGEELDWIQGIVTRVIGEGKSRRYEVRDPYPDDKTLDTVYKSSASQMVPIPPPGSKLEDYEVGKRVLALYPTTSTFYRADVKRMLEGGSKVELLFEEEIEGEQEKMVDRRLVLDHKGYLAGVLGQGRARCTEYYEGILLDSLRRGSATKDTAGDDIVGNDTSRTISLLHTYLFGRISKTTLFTSLCTGYLYVKESAQRCSHMIWRARAAIKRGAPETTALTGTRPPHLTLRPLHYDCPNVKVKYAISCSWRSNIPAPHIQATSPDGRDNAYLPDDGANMGGQISKMMGKIFGSKEMRLLMLGLDAAGKTTILYKLKLNQDVTTIPTVGFNVETVTYKNVKFNVWDVGGQDKIRPLWRHYFSGTQGLIFVIDSSDKARIDEARSELHRIINDREMKESLLLVFANKQDIPGAMKPQEVTDALKLNQLKDKIWFVVPSCATTGEGLLEGLAWLSNNVKSPPNTAGKK
ncbi:uncharacterized protein BP5553_03274 [Venustampulla echinocandica]|uniref:SGF29 C-terminal domain-containing protein n=1 Tax=Venustampulla echinocandica TaxID=2656787 RepID=A0A370TTU4_9HELO|nr:uncharacterized protein BP5553_03274 [Venustampulla echinocandica]RDL38934.1 hypothetical protein BP5553_03274 [Venustampulla echinocandica]